jgi:hypothetical protein
MAKWEGNLAAQGDRVRDSGTSHFISGGEKLDDDGDSETFQREWDRVRWGISFYLRLWPPWLEFFLRDKV